MDKRLILVDADSLCFQSSKDTLQESIQVMDEKIQNMYERTEATHAAFFIGFGRSFRKLLAHDYKSNRGKYQTSLKFLQSLKMYLKEQYLANSMELVESDDLVIYHFFNSDNAILCSPDKDILQAVPGSHFNYTYKLEEKGNPDSVVKGWWVNTNQEQADKFIWLQMLMGELSPKLIKFGEA